MAKTPKVLRITIEVDADVDDPSKREQTWRVYTFGSNRLITDTSRDRFFNEDTGEPLGDLDEKIKVGLAFGVRYSEHGLSSYNVSNDTGDGLIVWEDPEDCIGSLTVEDRCKDADSFLEEYTEWANGNCHYIAVRRIKSVSPDFDLNDNGFNGAFWERLENETRNSLIGTDAVMEALNEIKSKFPDYQIVVVGDGSWIND